VITTIIHFISKISKKFKIRHDLIKLLEILEEKSVVITKDTKEVIHKLNDVHSIHKLRYDFLINCKAFNLSILQINSMLEELLLTTKIKREGFAPSLGML
jgi:uncharacterized protein YfcZ (UPF0381/DUF406 family)